MTSPEATKMDACRRAGRSAGRWARSHFGLLAGLTLLVGLSLTLAGDRAALAGVDWSVDPVALAGAAALMAVAPLAQALSLRVALRRLGADPPAVDTLRVWARSYLLRYEPTGAVGFAYRVRERARLGATTPQILTASAYEQIAAVTAGAVVAVAASLAAGVRPSVLAWILAAGCAAAGLLARRLLVDPRVARWLSRRRAAIAGPLRGRTLAAMVALDMAGWTTTGLGAWVLAGALLGPRGAPSGLVLLGAFALAWVVGVLTPLLPGGLGPRDAALAVALTPVVGPGPAVVLAFGLRIVSLAGELLAVVVAEAAALVLVRRAAVGGAPIAGRPATRTDAATGGRSIVVVPTYDEREALPLFVARFGAAAAADFDLLVVDDSSPDGTGELADALAAGRPWMNVVHRAEKDGLGMAYRAGFAWCLERGYAVVGQMDGDLSHPPEKLAELRRVLVERDADLVLGSRYMPGGGTDGWSAARLALSRVGCRAARRVLGLPFSDLSGGFKLWRADCLAGLGLEDMLSAGYAFQVETTQLAFLDGRRIEEVPFAFSERVAGVSKMSLRITFEAIRVTLALRRRLRRHAGWTAPGAR
jgi:dolichol-phosphate mannosyltransferase